MPSTTGEITTGPAAARGAPGRSSDPGRDGDRSDPGDPDAGSADGAEAPGEPAAVNASDAAAHAEFRRFFERHHRELARLAFLLLGDADAADDLTADAFVAAWTRWDRVRAADQPAAYVRRILVNLCNSRIRTLIRERGKLAILAPGEEQRTDGPDVPAVVDVRAALQRLPLRKRACVVLRFAFDLSEQETARALGISVGTVKSQTSKGMRQLERELRGRPVVFSGADGPRVGE
ncbi:SigE family RNA polymerase sigma factor [Actinomadura opuntiae]|uniref:SigE family RNA polymerase sigma factor n=1 Tax=Actinomadura sp. OS1-43 TaxID=604315 RepID=UPI00255B36E3|nr:SigE family RNA polymerase sigma factor [Actinomadura sp. OS1-43]MDL4814266.1 SigE family RNA polymerase sigma factor [Actinomadura sp. OS1-43]